MGTLLPLPNKKAQPPIFVPCLLWPNGWMDQDATWYDGRLRPGQHCVICGPSSTPKGHSPQFSARLLWPNGWMNQDANWYEGRTRSRLYCVLHGDPAPPPQKKGSTAPNFRSMSIVAKRSPISATAEHLFYLPDAYL